MTARVLPTWLLARLMGICCALRTKMHTPMAPLDRRIWETRLSSCPIVWHVHIPKTGGTAIHAALKRTSGYFDTERIRRQIYIDHGRYLDWRSLPHNRRIIVSTEIGIPDLKRRGYPWFNRTCFFSAARDPYDWVLSADNHMWIASPRLHTGGISGTFGFFDQPNIQATMLNYTSAFETKAVMVCAATIEEIPSLLSVLNDSGHGRVDLPHTNVQRHATPRTKELEGLVRRKYNADLGLWGVVKERGVLCWS